MDTIGGRIRWLRKEQQKLTLEAFGQRIGITASSVSTIENNKNSPSEQTILSICREFSVNEVWLRTGVGEPFQKKERAQEMTELFSELMNDRPESFRTRLITALLRFKPDSPEWAVLEKIYNSIQDEANAETTEETDS